MSKFLHFPNLNALRAIAALLVLIHHTEQIKNSFNLDSFWNVPFFNVIGKLGVVLFFVLSGFLITYLLLNEEKNTNKINVKRFYFRRVLKIWPLYYFIIFLSYFVFPYISVLSIDNIQNEVISVKTFLLYIFMLPNLVLSNFGVVPYASQAWSIGTEEQFYLIWPLLFILFRKNKMLLMLSVIIGYIGVKYYLTINPKNLFGINLLDFWNTFNIDCMAIGGLTAILSFKKSKVLNCINNNYVFYLSTLIVIILMIFGVNFGFFHYEIYAILFAIIILNLATNKALEVILENKMFNYLGGISYGIYMYQSIAIVIAIKLSIYFNLELLIYPVSLSLTLLFSHLSFNYLEKPFLKLKNKFS
ncbi:acyltransferase family protein [Algoriella sp.]|uniref:acyltransferase family protein n=2 Tax=Algoriella sp. TaxID=1872434 RepID=UPI002FC63149